MSERDELRGTLSNTICNASNYTKRAQPYLLGSDMSVVLDKTADAILAAGYRKPRTITRVEELDALPEGSMILDSDPDVCSKNKGGTWTCISDPEWNHDAAAITLPVTVLHGPAPRP